MPTPTTMPPLPLVGPPTPTPTSCDGFVLLLLAVALQPPSSDGDDAMEHICGVCGVFGVPGVLTRRKSHELTTTTALGSSVDDGWPPFSSRERFGTRP